MRRIKVNPILATPLLLFCFAITLPADATNGDKVDRQVARSIIDTPASINLGSILAHQSALEFECAKYHGSQMRQIKKLVKFDESTDKFDLPRPLSVQVPAVCLFLFSQSEWAHSGHRRRLDMVNWLVDEHEYGHSNGSRHQEGLSKRAALSKLEEAGELLTNYLFNPADLDNAEDNTISDQPGDKLDLDRLIGDDRFKEMIERSDGKLAAYLSPVILIPGLLGSRLQAKIDKTDRVNILCSKEHGWQEMWLSVRQLLPIVVDCWLDNVRLVVDPRTGKPRSPPGVRTRVSDFGSVESVRHLDLNQPQLFRYFAPVIERLQQIGYTPDQNMLAAPYDFRLAPQQLAGYFVDLGRLVEGARSKWGRKATLICHSMGCTNLLVFLRLQTAEWRQDNVRKVIALSAPWGGAIKAVKALVVGDQLDIPLISETKMRDLARSFPSIAYLLPQAEVFARPSQHRVESGGPVMVETPEESFRVGQLPQLLKMLNLTLQYDWFRASASLIKPLEPLHDLQVDCFYSLNIPTPETVRFSQQANFPDGEYEVINSEGDGTVNMESLVVCDEWARLLPGKVRSRMIKNAKHIETLSRKEVLDHLTLDALTH